MYVCMYVYMWKRSCLLRMCPCMYLVYACDAQKWTRNVVTSICRGDTRVCMYVYMWKTSYPLRMCPCMYVVYARIVQEAIRVFTTPTCSDGMYVCMHVCMYASEVIQHARICLFTWTHKCTHAYTCVKNSLFWGSYIQTHIHTYIHTYMNTYIHTYKWAQ